MDGSNGKKNGSLRLAVLAPDARPLTVGKPSREVDINIFDVSLAHDEALLRTTAKQQGNILTGTLLPY